MNPFDDGSRIFDGFEQIHSWERGESFELERATYARLAHLGIACSRAGVEPATIRRLASGKPGCDLALFGANACYTVRVAPPMVTLYAIGLDACHIPLTPGLELFQGEDTFRDWFRVTNMILVHENAPNQTLEEASEAFDAQDDDSEYGYGIY